MDTNYFLREIHWLIYKIRQPNDAAVIEATIKKMFRCKQAAKDAGFVGICGCKDAILECPGCPWRLMR